jgi:DNA-binding MarR family transcriptional regulator
MKIEEAIKQKSFPNQIEKVMVNVIYTGNYFNSLNIKRFKFHGISPEQYNVLRILRGSHPSSLSILDVSNRMLNRNSNATRLVEKLRVKDLIVRRVCEKDRRQVDVAISDKGLELLQIIDIDMKEWMDNFKDLTTEEAVHLNFLLDKMRG